MKAIQKNEFAEWTGFCTQKKIVDFNKCLIDGYHEFVSASK